MTPPRARVPALLAVFLVQLGLVSWQIATAARTLAEGTVWRLRTAPVDPLDPFRGRYVALEFPDAEVLYPPPWLDEPGAVVWVRLVEDGEGFAQFDIEQMPPEDAPYLRAELAWRTEDRASLRLPFDRYYLPEGLAPRAEEAYRQRAATGGTSWVTVRVKDGRAVLEDLYIDGVPVRELPD